MAVCPSARIHDGVIIVKGKRRIFNGKLTAAPKGHHLWTWPLRWRGAKHPKLGPGQPSLIFVGDMSDLFHEGRPDEIIGRVCATIALSDHIGLLLAKRAARMAEYFTKQSPRAVDRWQPKLWLGFSAERQKEFFLALARAWVIVAGEQGRHADCRDMDPTWARDVRDQCAAASIPLFMKQMAKGAPIPPDLQIRQFPSV